MNELRGGGEFGADATFFSRQIPVVEWSRGFLIWYDVSKWFPWLGSFCVYNLIHSFILFVLFQFR